jgi:hypothetical protein
MQLTINKYFFDRLKKLLIYWSINDEENIFYSWRFIICH